jgi:multiple sugar transport system substrate-binding protein
MKKLTRRDMLKLAGMTSAGALLAACSPASTPTSAPTQASQPEAPKVAEPTATTAPVAAEPTAVVNAFGKCDRPLTMMHGLTGSDGAVFATMLKTFTDQNTDFCLSSEGFAWDTFFQKYPTTVAAGQPPDMVIFHAAEVAQMASQGLMVSLDDMFTTGGLSKDDYNKNLMNQITVDGKTMCVPFDNHGWMLWLNTKLVKDAGLDPEKLPQNSEEFISWALKLTTDKNGKHPDESGFDKDNVQVWATEETWPRYTIPSTLWQYGTAVVSEDGKKATLGDDASIKAVQYWHDLMYKHFVSPPAIPNQTWAGDFFKASRMVFMWEGTWTQGFMIDNPDIAAVTKPQSLNSIAPDGKKAVKMDAHIMSVPTGVDAKGTEMAKKLMLWLAQNGAAWSKSGQVPANTKVLSDPEVLAHPSVVAAAAQFKEFGRPDTSSKYFVEIQTAWEAAVGNALAEAKADVATELKKGNEQVQAILDRG